MLVPSPVAPRGAKLIATQRTALDAYFERHHTPTRTPLLLALVLAGDKPATHITPASWAFSGNRFETDSQFRDLLDTLGLAAHHLTEMSGWFVAHHAVGLPCFPQRRALRQTRRGIVA